MIPEELEDDSDAQKIAEEYTSGEIKFGEFKERINFVAENGYDKKHKPGKVIHDEIRKEIYEYKNNNIPSGREYIVVNREQYNKILHDSRFLMRESRGDKMEIDGIEVKIDMNASNTPKIVESDKYEYEPESEKPIFTGTKMF